MELYLPWMAILLKGTTFFLKCLHRNADSSEENVKQPLIKKKNKMNNSKGNIFLSACITMAMQMSNSL